MVPGAFGGHSRRLPVFPGCQEGNHAAGSGLPAWANGRTRTDDALSQLLYRLSYDGVFSFGHYIALPAIAVLHRLSRVFCHHNIPPAPPPSTATHRPGTSAPPAPLHSIHQRLAADRIANAGGISRNFSALRLCNWSHPFLNFIAGSSSSVIYYLPLPCCTTCSRSPFPLCIVSNGRGPFAWWGLPELNRPCSHLSPYRPVPPGSVCRCLLPAVGLCFTCTLLARSV